MNESSLSFTINGKKIGCDAASTTQTLSQFLRARGLTGTKEGCAEGDCGACTVAMIDRGPDGHAVYRALNSCIALLPMVAGRELVTVEGLANGSLHPVQQAMVRCYGSQCGYCTPGFIMSMFEGYYRDDLTRDDQIADQLAGNLCRCTGYRPIREAMREALEHRKEGDVFQIRLKNGQKSEPFGPTPLAYEAGGAKFWRPTSLAELLAIKAANADAVLLGGATEIGVLVTKRGAAYPLLVSTEAVTELREVASTESQWSIGGAVTLTAIEEAMKGEFPSLDAMLPLFASRQIRNRATLAGNIATASPIGDMAPVLMSLGAQLILESTRGKRSVPIDQFFPGYRKTELAPDELIRAIVIPKSAKKDGVTRLRTSYKISKRRELDISIVVAAFAVDISDGRVVDAKIAYGGVAATTMRARRTEACLVGELWGSKAIDAARSALAAEFKPISDVRSGDAYRVALIVNLFEKFVAGEESSGESAMSFEKSASWGEGPIHRALPQDGAHGHVTGGAMYVGDEANRRSMLDIWPVMSPHAHARIVRFDASRARAMPGVVDVIFASDVPGQNDVGAIRKDEPLFASGEVLCHGQLVAIVVGESIDGCRRAALEVDVEYEPLDAIVGVRAAIAANSFHVEPHTIRRGDCDAALAASKHQIEGEFEVGGQEHFYLESQAAWAEPGDDGDIRVVSSTQHPSELQAVVSHVLKIARNRVVVEAPRMGGAFGGKETQGNTWGAAVALAAWRTRRPVRVQLDRDVDMAITGKRHPFLARFKVGFDDDGTICAARIDLASDGGWALDLSESVCNRALFHLDNAYYIPNVEFTGRVAKTHTVSNTAFRGFGGPQGMVVIEEIIDRVARTVHLEPEVVRERNMYRGDGEANTTHYGQAIGDNRIARIWSELKKSSEFDARRKEVRAFNDENTSVKRGIAITPAKFGISFTASFLNQAGALVMFYRDGTAQINQGGTEMGQGVVAKIQGIAMRELGLTSAQVRVMRTQTDKVPNTSATAASSGSDLNGAAVAAACVQLRERLEPIARELIGERYARAVGADAVQFAEGVAFDRLEPHHAVKISEVVDAAYMRQISLSATGYYKTPGLGYDRNRGKGRPFHYFASGAAVAEVEVDGRTGMKRVLRVDILHDVGESLNHSIDRGQIEGGFVQGMGWLTAEELKWSEKAVLQTHSASTYQIPSIGDTPPIFNVALLTEAHQGDVVHGSKAVGEPPLMLAISVREAIRDAVAAFRGEGEVRLASPATHEAIFASIHL